MDLCEGIYDVTSFALNRAYKDVVKPLADIYNKASDIMDKIPTPVKIAAGLVGGAIAIGTGIAPAIVAGTMIKAAVSGAVISGAMYGVSSLFTGNFDKKEFVNSMLHGATDMFMISGVTLGVKGVVDCVTRNSGRIREAMLANEEGSTNAVDKLDEFYESRVRGKTRYGKSSENVAKGESGTPKTSRRQAFRQAKEATEIPKSAQYKTHKFVYDGTSENRIVYEFEVNGERKYIIEHPFDKMGRGNHFHGADASKGTPFDKGRYNQYDRHFPEDFDGFY